MITTFPPTGGSGGGGSTINSEDVKAIVNAALADGTILELNYTQVDTYDQLPAADTQPNEAYIVRQASGSYFLLNRKKAGLYYSNGVEWMYMGNQISIDDGLASNESVWSSSKVNTELGTKSDSIHNHSLADLAEKSYNSLSNKPDLSSLHTHTNKTVLDGTQESFTTVLKNKLDGIESGATADMTAIEIKTSYESNSNTNAFTDAEKTRLASALTSETNTTLTLAGNVLTYTSENGTVTNHDLSIYLDDTNLARVIGGVYDAQTQSLVFTRDDNSTFSIDASMFLDDTNLVTSVNGQTGAVTIDLSGKQDTLYSGTNIKTINNQSILGSGNIDINGDQDLSSYSLTTHNHTLASLSEKSYNSLTDTPDLSLKVDKITGSSLVADIKVTSYDNHLLDTSNPHSVTKAQIGLSDVDNTSDVNKPISTATQQALNNKANIATTLSGYGITDAYTKSETDAAIASNTASILDIKTQGIKLYTGAYGLNWDETNGVYIRTGSSNYTAIQSMMRRCVLNTDGSVRYYLHPENSNYKEDGTLAVLDGTNGNVMVEIPLFYYKYNYVSVGGAVVHSHSISLTPEVGYTPHDAFVRGGVTKEYRYYPAYLGYSSGGKLLSISGVYPTVSQTIAQFRTLARANGAGWEQIDFLLYEAIALLAIIEYGTMNIQATLGQGRTALSGGTWVNGSGIGINGLSNSIGNASGNVTYVGSADDAAADGSFMSYRGCENFFGNVWRFVDGINAQGSNAKQIYINMNPATYASDVFTGDYVNIGVTTAGANGYARKLGNTRKGFIPIDVTGGSSSVGTTDYYYTSTTTNTIALVGSIANEGLTAGPLSLNVSNAASLSAVTVGAGICR